MESEKVKDIKNSIERKINRAENVGDDLVNCVSVIALKEYLTLINELESENERLIEDIPIPFMGTMLESQLLRDISNQKEGEIKALKDRIAELESELKEEKMCSFNRSTIIMLNEKELEHLKVGNERLANRITCQVIMPDEKVEEIKKECLEKIELAKGKLLKQFAERVKMEFYVQFDELIPSIMADRIDNILKEFLQ